MVELQHAPDLNTTCSYVSLQVTLPVQMPLQLLQLRMVWVKMISASSAWMTSRSPRSSHVDTLFVQAALTSTLVDVRRSVRRAEKSLESCEGISRPEDSPSPSYQCRCQATKDTRQFRSLTLFQVAFRRLAFIHDKPRIIVCLFVIKCGWIYKIWVEFIWHNLVWRCYRWHC